MENQKIELTVNFDRLIWVVLSVFIGLFVYNLMMDTLGKSIELNLFLEKGNPWIYKEGKYNNVPFIAGFDEDNKLDGFREIPDYIEFNFQSESEILLIDLSIKEQNLDENDKWIGDDSYLRHHKYKWNLDDLGSRIQITEIGKGMKRDYYHIFLGEFILKRKGEDLILYGENEDGEKIELHLSQKF